MHDFEPTPSHWVFDHLGHVCRELETSTRELVTTLGYSVVGRERLEEHLVDIAFLELGGLTIELLSPLPGNTVLTKFLARRGDALHHICFRVPSVSDEIRRLESAGVRLIDSIPRPGARAHTVAFLHPSSTAGILTELCGNP